MACCWFAGVLERPQSACCCDSGASSSVGAPSLAEMVPAWQQPAAPGRTQPAVSGGREGWTPAVNQAHFFDMQRRLGMANGFYFSMWPLYCRPREAIIAAARQAQHSRTSSSGAAAQPELLRVSRGTQRAIGVVWPLLRCLLTEDNAAGACCITRVACWQPPRALLQGIPFQSAWAGWYLLSHALPGLTAHGSTQSDPPPYPWRAA